MSLGFVVAQFSGFSITESMTGGLTGRRSVLNCSGKLNVHFPGTILHGQAFFFDDERPVEAILQASLASPQVTVSGGDV